MNTENIERLRQFLEYSKGDGVWNYCEYSWGLTNGLILALALLEGNNNPEYMDAPKEFSFKGGYIEQVTFPLTEKDVEKLTNAVPKNVYVGCSCKHAYKG